MVAIDMLIILSGTSLYVSLLEEKNKCKGFNDLKFLQQLAFYTVFIEAYNTLKEYVLISLGKHCIEGFPIFLLYNLLLFLFEI